MGTVKSASSAFGLCLRLGKGLLASICQTQNHDAVCPAQGGRLNFERTWSKMRELVLRPISSISTLAQSGDCRFWEKVWQPCKVTDRPQRESFASLALMHGEVDDRGKQRPVFTREAVSRSVRRWWRSPGPSTVCMRSRLAGKSVEPGDERLDKPDLQRERFRARLVARCLDASRARALR